VGAALEGIMGKESPGRLLSTQKLPIEIQLLGKELDKNVIIDFRIKGVCCNRRG
jgi:hypothetical protein